jgi:hypothetical protein
MCDSHTFPLSPVGQFDFEADHRVSTAFTYLYLRISEATGPLISPSFEHVAAAPPTCPPLLFLVHMSAGVLLFCK